MADQEESVGKAVHTAADWDESVKKAVHTMTDGEERAGLKPRGITFKSLTSANKPHLLEVPWPPQNSAAFGSISDSNQSKY